MATTDAMKNLFPSLTQAPPSAVDSNTTTVQTSMSVPKPAPTASMAVGGGDPGFIVNPPVFKAEVPSTMDATEIATSISEPTPLPQIPEQKIFQMADGRFYNPATGVSANTREEAMGIASATPGPSQSSQAAGAPAPSGTVVEDDVTATIRSLFPESDSMVKRYDDMRKASGIETDEAALAKVNEELADLTAVIQNTEAEVRAQAGGMADESFIQATVSDRIRRLQPRINQLSTRQSALSSNIQAKKDSIAERIGLSKFDMERSSEERDKTRGRIFELIDIYGSKAFEGVAPEVIAEMERKAGLPAGSIAGRLTLEERKAEAEAKVGPSVSEKYGSGIIGEYNFYAEQERNAGRTPVSFTDYQDMDANRRKSVARAGSGGGSVSTAPSDEIDTLAAMYNRGESLGTMGATKKAQVVKRAAELKEEEALQQLYDPANLAGVFEEAGLAGQGIGAAVADARTAGVPEDVIQEALRIRGEDEKASSDSFWERLFYKA